MSIGIPALVQEIVRRRRGSVAIQIGLMMIVILGMVALGTEITFVMFKHRQMQSAADSAALGGATALGTGYPADFTLQARAIAATAGFVHGVDDVTVAVNNPPTMGAHAGDTGAVEVIVSQPQTLGMVSLFRSGLFDVGARAVAIQGNTSLYCILALDPTASSAVRIQNNGVVSSTECGVAVNSNSDTALVLRNNAAINGPVSVHGDWSLSNNAVLNGNPLVNHGPVIADPYAGVQLQTIPSCTGQSGSGGNNATINLTPGHFCGGWNYQNNVTVNLAPGAYYVDQRMILRNNAVLNAAGGVTLIVNGNYAIDLENNVTLNITAPATGDYAGLAFFGLRNATPSVTQTFENNAILNIKGVVYFPNQIIEFENNGSTTPGGCTQVIGRIIYISNNVDLDRSCAGTGVKPIGSSPSRLTE
jgi:Flp pilus assembly protein TadG